MANSKKHGDAVKLWADYNWATNFYGLYASEAIVAISYSFRGTEHEYGNENTKLDTVSKKSANFYYIFKKYVHQIFNDKVRHYFALAVACVRNEVCVK